jgi:hypothetical protein
LCVKTKEAQPGAFHWQTVEESAVHRTQHIMNLIGDYRWTTLIFVMIVFITAVARYDLILKEEY